MSPVRYSSRADQARGEMISMWYRFLLVLPLPCLLSLSCATPPEPSKRPPPVREHSDTFFQRLQHEEHASQQQEQSGSKTSQDLTPLAEPSIESPAGTTSPAPPTAPITPTTPTSKAAAQYSETEYLLAIGHGDLTKGPLVCERVSDTAARAELAKQIRVFVKEHAIDRVRERSGQPFEQDIEVVREETTNEMLQDVRIIARTMDKAANICTSTAVMPKNLIMQKAAINPGNAPTSP